MKIHYNSPFVLTYTLLSVSVMILSIMTNGQSTVYFFTVYTPDSLFHPISFFRLFSHIFGHADWEHLIGNFTFILLLGPMLEEKYGTKNLLIMSMITAIVTGLINIFLFDSGLLGASGVVFMMILLSSITNVHSGRVPLTFLLIVFLFLGKEIYFSLLQDNISQTAHIFGGICGSIFGFRKNGS